ncbi:hypothetical protein AB1K70_23575 [Bremerella sp. JC770]|uniref:hypothetical protein n=1 Tax=Bremerella sp. JC770 TaxID=3232137 RepID=UPI003458D312
MAQISGQITMEGVPIEQGQILFEPLDGESAIGTGIIDNGKYDVECLPGNYKVMITGTRKIPGAPPISNIPGEEIEAREPIVPKKYNRETTLEKEVSPGEQTLDFHLEK